jgi:hypothetical protein
MMHMHAEGGLRMYRVVMLCCTQRELFLHHCKYSPPQHQWLGWSPCRSRCYGCSQGRGLVCGRVPSRGRHGCGSGRGAAWPHHALLTAAPVAAECSGHGAVLTEAILWYHSQIPMFVNHSPSRVCEAGLVRVTRQGGQNMYSRQGRVSSVLDSTACSAGICRVAVLGRQVHAVVQPSWLNLLGCRNTCRGTGREVCCGPRQHRHKFVFSSKWR